MNIFSHHQYYFLIKLTFKVALQHIFNVVTLFKGIEGGETLFSQLDFILKSFIQATRCFLQISEIQSNF